MPWYSYKRGGWQIAVDAVSRQDAAQHIKMHAPGAEFQGECSPRPIAGGPSMATAMTTTRRQEQISATIRRQGEQWEAAGRPGAWWEKPE